MPGLGYEIIPGCPRNPTCSSWRDNWYTILVLNDRGRWSSQPGMIQYCKIIESGDNLFWSSLYTTYDNSYRPILSLIHNSWIHWSQAQLQSFCLCPFIFHEEKCKGESLSIYIVAVGWKPCKSSLGDLDISSQRIIWFWHESPTEVAWNSENLHSASRVWHF